VPPSTAIVTRMVLVGGLVLVVLVVVLVMAAVNGMRKR
jgi:hypothetical protein